MAGYPPAFKIIETKENISMQAIQFQRSTELSWCATEFPWCTTELPWCATEPSWCSTELPLCSTELSWRATVLPWNITEPTFRSKISSRFITETLLGKHNLRLRNHSQRQPLPPSKISKKAVPFKKIFYTAFQKTKGLVHIGASLLYCFIFTNFALLQNYYLSLP